MKTILEGAMLIYLLSMWESHMPTDVHEWLSIGEKRRLNAYKHVRDSAAHKYNGERAKNHNNKVQAFESEMPFSNIIWDQNSDTIDLSNSSISYDFYQYMDNLIKSLIVRFYKNEKPSASKKS